MAENAMTRREFFIGAAAVTAAPMVSKAMMAGNCADENLSVFISDIHVSGPDVRGTVRGDQPTYTRAYFDRTVDEILAMSPRPKRVVCFGDIAMWFGMHQDYEASLPGFRRLREAGVDVALALGNHDKRGVFARYHPEQAKASPVPGRIVSVVDLGTCDLLLLDSLNETSPDEGVMNAGGGCIDRAQWDWLKAEAARRTRPFLCGAHHSPRQLVQEEGGRKLDVLVFLKESPWFRGWVRGHDHFWSTEFHFQKEKTFPNVALPSTGFWGDVGFVTCRTYDDRAVLTLAERDFFYPKPLPAGERRPSAWDRQVADRDGLRCTFMY